MPTVEGNLLFVSSRAAQVSEVWVRAPKVRTYVEGVVTTGNDRFPVDGGEVTFTAVPGPAVLALISQGRAVDTIPILVGDAATQTLRQVVSAAKIADDATKREIEKLAAQAIHLVDSSTENARKAQDGASRAETAAGNAKQSETNAASSASAAMKSDISADGAARRASDSATSANRSSTYANKAKSDAEKSAASAKQDADRAANVANSTSWNGDRLTVNGKTSPSLRGPKGDPGASTMADISDLPEITPLARENAVVQRLDNGHILVLNDPPNSFSAVNKGYVDTAVAAEKARTVGVTWTVSKESDVAAKAGAVQAGDYIQVAQTKTIYRVTSSGVVVDRYGTRTLQASTDPNSNRNPNQWLESGDPWAGVNWSRVSPPAGKWLVELINQHDFSASLYVSGKSVGSVTKGTMSYITEFSTAAKSDVYVQIPGDNYYKPLALRFTPIN